MLNELVRQGRHPAFAAVEIAGVKEESEGQLLSVFLALHPEMRNRLLIRCQAESWHPKKD